MYEKDTYVNKNPKIVLDTAIDMSYIVRMASARLEIRIKKVDKKQLWQASRTMGLTPSLVIRLLILNWLDPDSNTLPMRRLAVRGNRPTP